MITSPTADRTRYSKLTKFNTRRLFSPTSPGDVNELRFYMENGRWRDNCPFYLEYPWEDIPAMCKDKYISYNLLSK